MKASDILLQSMRLANTCSGWERGTKRLWPTITRQSLDEAWGFSLVVGSDVGEATAQWSGVVSHRNDKGIWIKVGVGTSTVVVGVPSVRS